MSDITSVQTIKELFLQEGIIKIPPYQRAYSWETKQWKQFLGDLNEQKSDRRYHFGQFIFETFKNNQYNLVDGQQRLTTMVLFFAALARIDKTNDKYILYLSDKMHSIDVDDEIFTAIKNSNVIDSKEKTLTQSQKKMIEAFLFFEKELKCYDELKRKICYKNAENAVVGIFYVKDGLEATQVFEYQNSRGIKATEFELVKAYLMHQVYSISRSENSANENIIVIQKTVTDIYRAIENVNDYFSEDHLLDRFCWLKYYCYGTLEAVKKITTGIDESAEDGITESKEKKNILQIKTIKDIIEFFNDFYEICYAASEIVKQNTKQNIANLFFLSTDLYWDCILITLQIRNKQSISNDLLKLIELACMQVMLISLDSKKSKKDFLWDLSYQFYHIEIDYKTFYTTLKKWVFDGECPNGKKWLNISKLISLFKEYKTEHYYYNDVTKYILWQYENDFRTEREDCSTLLDKKIYEKYTIEHILAKKSEDKENTETFQERCMNCIGNLSLLSNKDNTSISNDTFYEKKKKYKEIVDKKELILYEEIIDEKEWRQTEVNKRRDKIYLFIDRYFKC